MQEDRLNSKLPAPRIHLKAKKSLGQNFLTSEKILSAIVAAGEVVTGDAVLEIGPGKGSLTEKLLETGARVIAIEKDDRLVSLLSEKFGSNPHFTLIHGDILEKLQAISEKLGASYKIVANLPYYITGTFLEQVFALGNKPFLVVLLLQREVALRIVARDGKESILSMSVKAYGTPEYVQTVEARYFSPKPSIDSGILKITNISNGFFDEHRITEAAFFDIVKRGFAHKRKQLRGNLGISQESLVECGLPSDARAETLSKEQWACLIKETAKYQVPSAEEGQ